MRSGSNSNLIPKPQSRNFMDNFSPMYHHYERWCLSQWEDWAGRHLSHNCHIQRSLWHGYTSFYPVETLPCGQAHHKHLNKVTCLSKVSKKKGKKFPKGDSVWWKLLFALCWRVMCYGSCGRLWIHTAVTLVRERWRGDGGYWDSNYHLIICPGENISKSHIPNSPLTTKSAPKWLD